MALKFSFLLMLLMLMLFNSVAAQQMIYNCSGLQNMLNSLTGNYVLANSIDCSATVNWNAGAGFVPIGSPSTPFIGTFNGGNYTIYNLTIRRPTLSYVGLFGYVGYVSGAGAKIMQICLKGITIQGNSYVGGLVGENDGTITNCNVTGNVSASNVYVGGLVGYNFDSCTISNCYATGTVTGPSTVGGLVGENDGTITNCYATGTVTGAGTIGGLVGENVGTITLCYATGNVTGSTDYVGGLAGFNSYGTITQCYATGRVTGSSDYVGGLVGFNNGATLTQCYATGTVTGLGSIGYVGGLAGSNGYGTITQCYATGSVTGSSDYVGGLAGYNGGTTTQCYSTGNVSGSSIVGGLVGENYNGGTLTQCYSTGSVTGSSVVGGLVGDNEDTIINSYAIGPVSSPSKVGGLIGTGGGGAYSSYWDIQTTGQTLSVGGMGKTTLTLYHNATYLGWDFSCIWSINEGKTTPQLTLNNCGPPSLVQMPVSNCNELQLAVFLYTVEITLTQDIDCSASATWDNGAGFYPGLLSAGTFNGLGHRIVNLMINRTSLSQIGLFGEADNGVQITSVILEQSLILGGTNVGTLVGANAGVISQCAVTGSVSAQAILGILVGVNSGVIIQSSATGNVSGLNNVGGLVGSNGGTISNTYASGSVSGFSTVGGLVGINGGSGATITQSYAIANVFGSSDTVGGLVGENDATINNAYATGSVSGLSAVGGLVGNNNVDGATITQCYAAGNINGSSYVGGLVGNGGGTVLYAYWDMLTSTQIVSAAGVGLTTQTMQQPASFAGWDFAAIWVIYAGHTYPLLQAFIVPPGLFSPLNNVTHYIGTLFELTIPANTFTNPSGLRLTYSALLVGGYPLPAWLLFIPSTQTFVGTPASGAQGISMIAVSVYNLPNQLTTDIWQLTIPDRPPIVNAPFTQQTAFNGQAFQFVIPDVTFFDPDGDRLQLSAVSQGATLLPSWLNFNAPLGIFSGTSTHRGNQWINVTANDGFGGQVSALLEIVTPNTAPTTTGSFPNQVVVIAQLFSFTIPANLFFDLDGDPLIYSASLFGGGQLLSWLNFNAQTLTFQGTPDALGFLVVSVTATDPYNATASLNFGVSVSALAGNAPPLLAIQMLDQTATINQPFTLPLPQNMFIDTNGSPLTYSAMLEGGAPLPSWLNFSSTTLVFSGVSPTTGSLHITVRADNGGGGFALDTFTLTITSNQNLPPFLQNPISNQVVAVGENYQFTVPSNTFVDLNNGLLTYTATTSPNDPLPGWLHFSATTRTFLGTPSDTDTNLYAARITTIEVRASNGIGSAITTFQLSVTGKSQAEIIVNVLITLASIASTAFALYRNRALLWNTLFKKKYEKETKQIALNELFTYQFTVPGEKIMCVEAFNKASPILSHKKWCRCFQGIGFNQYQKLHDKNDLPEWLSFNRKTITLSGVPNEPADLYICAVGFDGRYLEAFKLRCGASQGKDIELNSI